jgi:hypothetical protein
MVSEADKAISAGRPFSGDAGLKRRGCAGSARRGGVSVNYDDLEDVDVSDQARLDGVVPDQEIGPVPRFFAKQPAVLGELRHASPENGPREEPPHPVRGPASMTTLDLDRRADNLGGPKEPPESTA